MWIWSRFLFCAEADAEMMDVIGKWTDKVTTKQEFMNLVAAECAVQKHHPEWSNVRYLPCFFSSFSKVGTSRHALGLQHDIHSLDDPFPTWLV